MVARAPTVLPPAFVASPERQAAQQRSELAVAGWLADRDHPVVAPSPLVPRKPVRHEGFSMTFWQYVEEVPRTLLQPLDVLPVAEAGGFQSCCGCSSGGLEQ
ncbi:hypothetical protein [Mycolicibacterium chitae]|uniref:hypothetical protein n=1 Tax=Mycolicibacterium chitae TaxID=1792 RepID=UPI0021F2CA7C|nr:hypothetical protein [Mycolicibacterium chitae]